MFEPPGFKQNTPTIIQQTIQEQEAQAAAQLAAKEQLYNKECNKIQSVIYRLIREYVHSEIFAMKSSFEPYNGYSNYNAQVKLTDLSAGNYHVVLSSGVSRDKATEVSYKFEAVALLKELVIKNLVIHVFCDNESYFKSSLEASPSDLESADALKKKLIAKLSWVQDKEYTIRVPVDSIQQLSEGSPNLVT